MHDIGLAKVQEEKYMELRRFSRFPANNTYSNHVSSSVLATPSSSQHPLLPKPQNMLPIRN